MANVLRVCNSRLRRVRAQRRTVYNRNHEATSALHALPDQVDPPDRLTVIDQFIAFLLAVYIEAGLVKVSEPLNSDVLAMTVF